MQHPSGENSEVVNIKKGIASAFQTNFKGTTEEEEEDTMSQHTSSYRWVASIPYLPSRGKHSIFILANLHASQLNRYRGTNAYRTVNSNNVKAYAGGTPRGDMQLSKRERIRYSGGVLSYSSGNTEVVFAAGGGTAKQPSRGSQSILARVPQYQTNPGSIGPRRKRQALIPAIQGSIGIPGSAPPQTYDASVDVTEMKAQGQYQLTLVGCRSPAAPRGSAGPVRRRREAGDEGVTDSLRAKIDYSKTVLHSSLYGTSCKCTNQNAFTELIDQRQMQLLREKMPSIAQALNAVHQDTENMKLGEMRADPFTMKSSAD